MLKQLSVFVENKVGSLRKVTAAFKTRNISIRAISAFDSPDFSILRVVVDKPDEAMELLKEEGFAVKISEVLAVELADRPGALDEVLGILAENQFNLNYIYSFVLRDNKNPLMVINTPELERAAGVLEQHGITVSGLA